MFDRSKIAFNAFWFEGLDTPDKIKSVCNGLAEIGYRGVEWKETCFSGDADIFAKLKMAADASRECGLYVTDFVILRNLANPETAPKAADDLCTFIRASAESGVKVVNTASSAPVPKSLPPEEWWRPEESDFTKSWDTLESSLTKAVKVAEKEGVFIAFETIFGTLVHDYYSMAELLRRIDSPYMAVGFDPSHHIIHNIDIRWAIKTLGDKIKHVHVKDAVGNPGRFGKDMLFPILGEGAVNWQEFFQAFDEINYQGWMAIEFESFKFMAEVLNGDAMEAARLSMRSYKALSNYQEARKPK